MGKHRRNTCCKLDVLELQDQPNQTCVQMSEGLASCASKQKEFLTGFSASPAAAPRLTSTAPGGGNNWRSALVLALVLASCLTIVIGSFARRSPSALSDHGATLQGPISPVGDQNQLVALLSKRLLRQFSPSRNTHWLVGHVAKAAGTSFRETVIDLAHDAGLSVQVTYGQEADLRLFRTYKSRGKPVLPYNESNPAEVIFGHEICGPTDFALSALSGKQIRRITMLRDPVDHSISYYQHEKRYQLTQAKSALEYFRTELARCPCILLHADVGQSTSCESTYFGYWFAPATQEYSSENIPICTRRSQEIEAKPCELVLEAWRRMDLVLLTERYVGSIELLRDELGLPLQQQEASPYNLNRIPHHRGPRERSQLLEALQGTCIPAVYAQASLQYSQHAMQLAAKRVMQSMALLRTHRTTP